MRVRFEPFGVTISVESGATVLEAADAVGVEIESVCGGRGTCAKCKVICSGGLSEPTDLERRGLSADEMAQGYRLACQASILSDVDVVVPEESRLSRVSILVDGLQMRTDLAPWAHRYTLDIPFATLEDQTPDADNVAGVWESETGRSMKATLRALRQLPTALRAQGGRISLIEVDDEIIRIAPPDSIGRLMGMAVDIGTTTVVGYLMDLVTGEQLAVSSLLNPQTRFGDDVVSRIEFSTEKDGLQQMQSIIVKALNEIVGRTTAEVGGSRDDVVAMAVVGNTTMQHFFLGISPAALAQSPYVPVVSEAQCVDAEDLGLEIYAGAHVWTLPNIAGWVGADTVGVLLATGIYDDLEPALAIDIGTNGEMAMGFRDRLIACSTAAGPAFEGAHLSCGMRAADGAIDTVSMNDSVEWHTIGGAAPRGVCGSGLVDLVAEMLRVGIINNTGMMQDSDTLEAQGSAQFASRIVSQGRRRSFRLVDGENGSGGREILVTQRDVRELQLAKGAIRAGIEILVKELGVTLDDVRRVYLAGAFGNYIKSESALGIGLMPHFQNAEIIPMGNAAGTGAKMALLSKPARDLSISITKGVEYLELSGRPDFQEEFAEAMIF